MNAADFALSSSIFSGRKVCVMYNVNSISQNASNREVLAELLIGSPGDNIIIMTSTENRPPKHITDEMLKTIKVVQFWRYYDSDILSYINITSARLNIKFDDKAVYSLIERTGKDIKKIDEALDVIAASGHADRVTVADIESFISDVKEITVFELTDLLFTGSRKASASAVKLIEEGAPDLLLLNLLVRQAENIERFHSFTAGGMSKDEALKKCGITERNREMFLKQTSLFGINKLKRFFFNAAKTDYKIKSRRLSKDVSSSPIVHLVSDMSL
jgi:DNA polymerase III delta subunit